MKKITQNLLLSVLYLSILRPKLASCTLALLFSISVSYGQTYCTGGANATSESIRNITFAGINNSSTSTINYEDFTSKIAQVQLGKSYLFAASILNFDNTGDEVRVWIDYNHNGDFTDDGELEISSGQLTEASYATNINIPNTATLGATRMRVRLNYNVTGYVPNTNPCGTTGGYGQVEDYTVYIGFATTISSTNVSTYGGTNGSVTVTATGGTAPYSYLWSTGAGTQSISGLSAGTYSVTVTDNAGITTTDAVTIIEPSPPKTIYVKADAAGNNDGTTWTNAVPELADALKWANQNQDPNWATTPLQIWVATGTYKPMYSPEDGAKFGTDRGAENSFLMVKNVKVYGGFAGTESSLSQRNLNANPTILSGDLGSSGNSYNIVVSSGAMGLATLDGFTIRDGNARSMANIYVNGNQIYQCSGGGIYNSVTDADYKNLIITNNFCGESGGGMFSYRSSVKLSHVIMKNNGARHGGAMANQDNSNAKVINTLFFSNNASDGGGAIYNVDGSLPKFVNITVANNLGNQTHGILNENNANPEVHNSIIWGGITGTYQAQNCIIQNSSHANNGNINAISLNDTDIFTDPANNDFTIKNSSLSIDAGSNALYEAADGDINNNSLANDKDLAGNSRVLNGTIDIGAYEKIDTSLPVTLVSFSAKKELSSVKLEWQTASELNNKLFSIYRSSNGKDFKLLTTVSGLGTSHQKNTYAAVDPVPYLGLNYYRLVQTDFDGKENELGVKYVDFAITEKASLSVAPNPAITQATVRFPIGTTKLCFFDLGGRMLKEVKISVLENTHTLSVSGLPRSTYMIKTYGKYGQAVAKLVKME